MQASVLAPQLTAALQRVLADGSYKAKAQHLSDLMRATRWTAAEQAACAPWLTPVATVCPDAVS